MLQNTKKKKKKKQYVMMQKAHIFDVKPERPNRIPDTPNIASTIIKQSHN